MGLGNHLALQTDQKTRLVFIMDPFSNPVHVTASQIAVLVLRAQEQEQGS